jgi:NAD(P)-dependent dehydrogenase (short-subunit alcohol dehydrogenase family)
MNQHNTARSDGGVAVVTGGASGIGFALARHYATKGARVLIADIDQEGTARAAAELTSSGATVVTAAVDLRDAAAVLGLAESAADLGTLTAVCLNAGVMASGTPVWETPDETTDFVMGINFTAVLHGIRAFVPRLIVQGSAADLIITASMAGMVASQYSGVYSASKAAVVALVKTMRAELQAVAPKIRVALLNPGMVKTNLIRSSAAQLPISGAMPAELIAGGHELLNQSGVEPAEAVSWAIRALDQNRFWALPPKGDPFMAILDIEQDELARASRG